MKTDTSKSDSLCQDEAMYLEGLHEGLLRAATIVRSLIKDGNDPLHLKIVFESIAQEIEKEADVA